MSKFKVDHKPELNRREAFQAAASNLDATFVAGKLTSADKVRSYYAAKLAAGMTPINRWGDPHEVALAVSAIARGHFPFSTGNVFHIDGGWHLREL